MKTNIYMDVDGVLNGVMAAPADGGWDRDTWRRFKAKGFYITFHTELIERLKAIEAREDVEIFWLTTWCDDAPALLSPEFGIGADWEVLGSYLYEHQGVTLGWWKATNIEAHLRETKPNKFVWLDDDIQHELGFTPEWIQEVPGLSIAPRLWVGLDKKQIKQIEIFLDS